MITPVVDRESPRLTGAPLGDALEVIRFAKSNRPELPIVCGGWHPSLFPKAMLDEPAIDYVVQGQGEETFKELVHCLVNDQSVENVSGITYRKDSQAISTLPRALVGFDDFQPVDYDLIPVERYFDKKGQIFDKTYTQSLEPRVRYLYIPEEDQSDLPVFDTGLYDLTSSYATLF